MTVTRRELAVERALDQARSRAENRVQLFLDAALELMSSNSGEFTVQEVAERSGRAMDHESEDSFERLRSAGYM